MTRRKSAHRLRAWRRNPRSDPPARHWADWLRRGWLDGLDCFHASFAGLREW